MSVLLLHGDAPTRAGELSRWLGAGLLVLGLHAAVVGILRARPAAMTPVEEAAVMVELAPLPVAPPDMPLDAPPAPDMVEAPEPVPEEAEPTPLERVEEVPPPAPQPVSAPEPLPDVAPMPEPVPEVAMAPVEDIEVPLPPPAPLSAELTPPERKVEPPPRERKAELVPPERKPAPPRTRPKPQPKPQREASERPPAPRSSVRSSVSAAPSNRVAAPTAGAASSRSVSPANWRSQLMAHLNRHKRYPDNVAGARGQPRVAFTIDRGGRVTSARLTGSSGNGGLDAEAVAMIRRASPVPPPPADMPGSSFSFVVPVRFDLR